MAFTVTPLSPAKPGDLIHFWDVNASADGDTNGPWIAAGFDSSSGLPQFSDVFTTNGTNVQYVGRWRVEFNTTAVSATVPGFTNPLTGAVVADQTVTAPIGAAWRTVKGATAVDSNGTCRVAVGYFPGNLTDN